MNRDRRQCVGGAPHPAPTTVDCLRWALLCAAVLSGDGLACGAEARTAWLSGGALTLQLGARADVRWSTTPFRESLYGLSRSQRVAALLDRRVDPDQRVTLALHDKPLGEIFQEVAERHGLGQTLLGGTTYFGPPAAAARLRTAVELRRAEVRQLGAGVAARWMHSKPLRWPDLATPREILAGLLAEGQVRSPDLERTPHDLWAAADLPAAPLVERLSLVLVQYDLTFTFDAAAGALRFTPLPERVTTQREHPATRGATRPATARAGEKRFTLRQAKDRLGDLITKMAALLQLEVKMDREALRKALKDLDQAVSLSAADVTIDELFEKLLTPVGCQFRREGAVIEITAKPKQ